jgi:hypothetical protein
MRSIPKTIRSLSNLTMRCTRSQGAFLAGGSHVILFTFGILILLVTVLGLASSAQSAVLKSLQTGTTTMSGASVTATITAVDTTKAFLVFGVSENLGNGYDGQVTGQLTNATTITFTRIGNSGTVLPVMKWYVAEFSSAVSVQRGMADMNGLTTLAVTLTAVDTTKSFPIVSLRNSGGTTYDGNDFLKAKITSTTNLQLDLQTAGDGNCNVEWQVVTYADANVTSGDIAFATGDASKTATVSIPDLTKAWLVYTYNSASGTGTNIGQKLVRGQITNATTLTFDRCGEIGGRGRV